MLPYGPLVYRKANAERYGRFQGRFQGFFVGYAGIIGGFAVKVADGAAIQVDEVPVGGQAVAPAVRLPEQGKQEPFTYLRENRAVPPGQSQAGVGADYPIIQQQFLDADAIVSYQHSRPRKAVALGFRIILRRPVVGFLQLRVGNFGNGSYDYGVVPVYQVLDVLRRLEVGGERIPLAVIQSPSGVLFVSYPVDVLVVGLSASASDSQ